MVSTIHRLLQTRIYGCICRYWPAGGSRASQLMSSEVLCMDYVHQVRAAAWLTTVLPIQQWILALHISARTVLDAFLNRGRSKIYKRTIEGIQLDTEICIIYIYVYTYVYIHIHTQIYMYVCVWKHFQQLCITFQQKKHAVFLDLLTEYSTPG